MTQNNIDSRHSTTNTFERDQINNYYPYVPGSSNHQPLALSFNDAPTDLLSTHFTGREKELDDIETIFRTIRGNAPTRCAVHGMPGIGKTQMVLRFAQSRYNHQQYSLVFWISGATVEKLNQGFAKVLTLVGHPDYSNLDQSVRLTSARRWLEEPNVNGPGPCRWLLVLDNVSQEAVGFLREHLPRRNSSGNILFTTRTRAIAEAVTAVAGEQHQISELGIPSLEHAANQFLKEAGIDAVSASTSGAEALVKCIGRLPLAISHAGSFTKQSHKHLDDVLGLYQSKHKYDVISWTNELSNYEHKSVTVTFTTQLEELDLQSHVYSSLLKILSFFDAESIPLNIITDGVKNLQSSLGLKSPDDITSPDVEAVVDLMSSPVRLQQAIQKLHHLSLIGYESIADASSPNAATSTLRIHDLIKFMIQECLRRENTQHQFFDVAVRLVVGASLRINDSMSPLCWAQCETLSPHMQSLTTWDDEHAVANPEVDQANITIARYFASRGRYSEAEMLFKRVLTNRELLLGPEHPLSLNAAHDLAVAYSFLNRVNEAVTLCQWVMAVSEKRLGPKHPDTLLVLQNLADCYRSQGRYTEAETLFGRALEGIGELYGPEHPATLKTVTAIAALYGLQGRFKEAETLLCRASACTEKVLGPKHPDTLRTMALLAKQYHFQGRYEEAETLYQQTLTASEQVLGFEHPEILWIVNDLAINLRNQGRYTEAEILFSRALEGREKVLGPEDLRTLYTVSGLAVNCRLQGHYDEADALFGQALKGREHLLGLEDPLTLRTVNDLADSYRLQGRHMDVEILFRWASTGRQQQLCKSASINFAQGE